MTNNDWPDGYPEKLKSISWRIQSSDGDIIAGPSRYYNRHLPYNTKGSSLFTKQVLVDYFKKNGLEFNDLINETAQYMAKSFTVYYRENSGEFQISAKKDKETKQPLFNIVEILRLWPDLDQKGAVKLVKQLLNEWKTIYNSMLRS